MNTNEVLANLATRKLGKPVHPNDHVNASQSSNDVFPTSVHVAVTGALLGDLVPALDHLATALEAGENVALGVLPATDPGGSGDFPSETAATERVLRWLDIVGLDPEVVGSLLVVTPACGMAGASPAWARQALELSRRTAGNLP